MDGSKTIEARTVYNKPFFVNELLDAIQPDTISPNVFNEMVKESSVFELSTILTAMIRQIDISGMVPNFTGVFDDPQDVLEALMNLGHMQLLKIAQFDRELQYEIFATLQGSRGASLRALLVLDECQQEVIGHLIQVRQQSPLAMALRQATEEALKDLYQNPKKLHSPMFDEVICCGDPEVLYHGVPRICYPKRVHNGAIVEVWQFFVMPKVEEIHLPNPFQTYKVGRILDQITPKIYQRQLSDDELFNPRTPSGFMGLLGKVGGALPRLLARQVKKNEQIRDQALREQEIAAALHDLFYH